MKAVKGQLQLLMSTLFTLMIVMVLFVIIFVVFDKQEPDAQFWTELITTSVLAISAKITWYSSAESNRMEEADIVTAKDKYFRYVDDNVTDIKDFDAFLVMLNQERKEKYITRKMGSRTPENCKNYDKLLLKYQRKADKLKETTSIELITNTGITDDTNTRDYTKVYKGIYLSFGTAISLFCSILLAFVAVKDIMWNVANLFKYLSYLFTVLTSTVSAVLKARKNTAKGVLDHLSRMSYVITRYINYKKEAVVPDGKLQHNSSAIGHSEMVQRPSGTTSQLQYVE